MNDVLSWLKNNWFIFVALVAAGITWGQTVTKVAELETRISKIENIVSSQTRIDERTLMMQDELRDQKKIILDLLTAQKELIRQAKVLEKKVEVVPAKTTMKDEK